MIDSHPRPIAIFIPTLAGGGAESVMTTLANGFVGLGYRVDLLLVSAIGPHLARLDPAVRVVQLGGRGVLSAIPALSKYLRRTPPVALLSAMSHTNVAALLGHWISGRRTRLVISERMSVAARKDLYDSPKERLLWQLMRILYKRADAIIAVSGQMADDLSDGLALPRDRIEVLPNPLVSARLLADSEWEPAEPWWPPAGAGPLILAVGRLSAVKNYTLLIRAVGSIRKVRPVRLLILGEGEERQRLEALVAELGLGAAVTLPGYVSNPAAYMRRADLFVLSSSYEGLPGVLVQAMACGVPVVSTDCLTGPREILENGRWGRLVPVNDQAALAAAIEATLDDQSHPDVTVGAQAYGVEQAVRAYLQVLLAHSKQA